MPREAYLVMEIGTAVLFAFTVLHARRRGDRIVLELASAAAFGLLLELGDIAFFGTYFYSSGFHLSIGWVPVTVALAWAMIIYGAMAYTDRMGIPPRVAPLADALWVILLDLSFEAIAIRLGLWQWHISIQDGYFGVPAGNFYAWVTVAASFSLMTRLVRLRFASRVQLIVPLVAYPLFLLSLVPIVLITETLYPQASEIGAGLEVFAVMLILMAWLVYRHAQAATPSSGGLDALPTATRWSIHLFFLTSFILFGAYGQAPFLILMALALLGVEAIMLLPALLPGRSTPGRPTTGLARTAGQTRVERRALIGKRRAPSQGG